ncbi:hypothetical protein JRO89_XS09G0167300 [Xanthoceras sorbifolium]|uniref:Uncharacterized protein n=1 Tax=Xanthoceras sorbifolium TaxID=99658 RepID=A0ABQ8HLK8_9ROSI|nr:hypothetical protein JRO89_XS09G0167300 [Xanthoceras sorbifolium]
MQPPALLKNCVVLKFEFPLVDLMAAVGSVWCGMKLRLIAAVLIGLLLVASMSVSAESSLIQETKDQNENEEVKLNQVMKVSTLKSQSGYQHVWPVRNGSQAEEFKCEPESLGNTALKETKEPKRSQVSILENVYWKELGLLVAVWVIILALQIAKNYTVTCSVMYWVLNSLQVTVGVSAYEAVKLYKGRRKIASKGEVATNWKAHELVFHCFCGITFDVLGGGFILGPLFLELGIPPQHQTASIALELGCYKENAEIPASAVTSGRDTSPDGRL